jgi:arabinan endo-1,5-alpha-L-arabinosidase
MRGVAAVLSAIALVGFSTTAPAQPPTYVNPVFDENFPDPAVLRAPDGFYYAFATQGEHDGRMLNIQVARSEDLVTWERRGDALPTKPDWASRTQDFWAPHVSHHEGRYILYYSAKPDAALTDSARGLCLAVATATSPEGPYSDVGAPLRCGEGFVNIDPFAFDDPATGAPLLYWGSGFEPIRVQPLAPDRTSFAPGSRPIDLVAVVPDEDPTNYQRLVEGAWVVREGGWYFLFYSGDNCCGPKAHYAVMVARSRSATGPFETLAQAAGVPSSVILERSGRWIAPGHNSVVQDAAGAHWVLYHAVDALRPRDKPSEDVNTRRVMLLDRLTIENGWPRIGGGEPSASATTAPAQGEAERP